MRRVAAVFVLSAVISQVNFIEAKETDALATEQKLLQARPIPLQDVRLTGGPLRHAMDLDCKTLLGLEPDRMMAGYRIRAGMEPKARGYGGWDSVEGRQLTGHIAGHYLSAVSIMYAATGDERFKERADYLVRQMKEVQDKRGSGYLGALANRDGVDGAEIFEQQVAKGEIRSSGFDLNGMWAPWYTLHKTYAGLRDAYRYTGNKQALELEIRFAEWAQSVLSGLSETQIQQMLNTEFGGMNEILVDLYADTGNPRWLDLSYKFEHESFTTPLMRHQDNLAGKHGNTQVPKLIGSADRFAYTGQAEDILAAGFFWDRVVHHHSYATGGHGKDEYFGLQDQLSDRVDGRTCETCNVYNMLKLTRRLFALRPDAWYADFHEQALFNHILASLDPTDGWACYMVPVGRGVRHEYERNMLDGSFTCCTGSSLESHALHSDGLYYESGDTFFVNLYAPSTAEWKAKGTSFKMETDFPEGQSAALEVSGKGGRFTLALRRPQWVADGFAVRINGEPVADELLSGPRVRGVGRNRRGDSENPEQRSGHFVRLDHQWADGDRVEVVLPKSLRLVPTPDNPRRAAIAWGPLVMAGDLGPEQQSRPERIPVLVAVDKPIDEWLRPVDGKPGHFKTAGVGQPAEVEMVPFYRLHRRTYAVYWDLFTSDEWKVKEAEYAAEEQRRRKLEEATIAYAQPGEMQPERNFNFQAAEDSDPIRIEGRPGRRGRSWFSFDLPVEADHPMALVVTYYSGERSRQPAKFNLLVDGKTIATEEVTSSEPHRFYDVEYRIDEKHIKDKDKVTIRFQAAEESRLASVFGLRMIRLEASQQPK